jgi:hypothetical protein
MARSGALAGQGRREWRNAATKDADDAHDDPEGSDTMSTDRKPEGAAAMLSIAETVTLCEAGLAELGTLIFGRKKQREKQRT